MRFPRTNRRPDVTRIGAPGVSEAVELALVVEPGVPDVPAAHASEAVAALYREEAARLVGMLTVYVGDRGVAEELAQEAFLRLQRSWDRVREPEAAAAYLRSVAFNLARSRFRRLARAVVPFAREVAVGSAEDGFVLRDDQRAVVAAVAQLPSQQRGCVVLRYYADLGIGDIARTLGISENSVKTHLRRALDRLETLLEDRR